MASNFHWAQFLLLNDKLSRPTDLLVVKVHMRDDQPKSRPLNCFLFRLWYLPHWQTLLSFSIYLLQRKQFDSLTSSSFSWSWLTFTFCLSTRSILGLVSGSSFVYRRALSNSKSKRQLCYTLKRYIFLWIALHYLPAVITLITFCFNNYNQNDFLIFVYYLHLHTELQLWYNWKG